MNKYEITIITKEDTKDAPVKKEIEDLGGKIIETSSIGQKQFVYRIKKETAGVYKTVVFELEPTKVLELNKKLSLNPEILRHLIITTKAAKAQAPKKEKVKIQEKPPMVAPETEIKTLPTREIVTKPTPTKALLKTEKEPVKVTKPVVKPAPQPKPKVSPIEEEEETREERLKALDKKLDELLKE